MPDPGVVREPRRRVFFALWPDEETRRALLRATRSAVRRCGGRATPSDNLHVTLAFLGPVTATLLERVCQVPPLPAPAFELVFDRQGAYDVTCNAHDDMRAFIYATTTPYAAFADDAGYFRLSGVPPGTYTLSVWSVDPELRSEQTIAVSAGRTEIDLGSSP